jgi:RNA polymerase sigma-70 factor (ECF subfamily)
MRRSTITIDDDPRGQLDEVAAEFDLVRPRLFGIAYRILSSVSEAEDIVQEAWLRWQGTDRTVVVTPIAFLSTVTTRLAINVAQSSRARRETYIGPWLPEPVDTSQDPALGAERSEAIELAVLVILERLAPKERAAYVLREAFDYPYQLIAEILQLTESNARQLVTRARRHIVDGRREPVSARDHERMLSAFVAAARLGDVTALENILAEDVVSYSDGGGVARTAARIPVAGRERVAQFVAAFAQHFWESTTLLRIEANGKPAMLIVRDHLTVAMTVSTAGIDQILWVMNPEKLESIARAAVREDLG